MQAPLTGGATFDRIRCRMRLLSSSVSSCPVVLAAACGSSGSRIYGSLNGESPSEILALTTTAISVNGSSFHFVDQSRVGSKTTTLAGDDTAAGSYQVLSGSGAALEVVQQSGQEPVRAGCGGGDRRGALGLSPVGDGQRRQVDLPPAGQTPLQVRWRERSIPQKELNIFVPMAPYTIQAPRGLPRPHRRRGGSGRARIISGERHRPRRHDLCSHQAPVHAGRGDPHLRQRVEQRRGSRRLQSLGPEVQPRRPDRRRCLSSLAG